MSKVDENELLERIAELQQALESKPLGEAPVVIWTDVYAASGAKFSVTVRGNDGIDALDRLVNLLRYSRDTYGLLAERPVNEAVATRLAQQAAQPSNAMRPAPTAPGRPQASAQAQAGAPDSKGRVPGQIIKEAISKIAILRRGEKTSVEFYPTINGEPGKYKVADMNVHKNVDEIAEMLSPWGFGYEDVDRGGEWNVADFVLVYKISTKQKNSGNYFQDFVGVELPA